uniref:Ig-like domain-containing protein n=1 Tax=Accipiter nisus TaxID=211598 RepID=A0A8B9RVE0_9AVES
MLKTLLLTPLLDPQGYSGPCSHPDWGCPPSLGTSGGPWAAWMPPAVAGLSGTCVAVPCRFGYPEELRPATVHGLWYFGSPYPKNYPPVVARSRTGAVHESFTGRAKLVGDPGVRDCSLLLGPLSPELAGKYYFRGDLGGYNQYSFSEHTILESPLGNGAVEGTPVELGCEAEGRPPPLLSWFRGVTVLREEPVSTGLRLVLPRVEPDHGGVTPGSLFLKGDHSWVPFGGPLLGGSLFFGGGGTPGSLLGSWGALLGAFWDSHSWGTLLGLFWGGGGDTPGSPSWGSPNLPPPPPPPLFFIDAPRSPILNGSLWVVAGDPVTVTCGAASHPAPIVTVTRGRRVVATAIYEPQVTMTLAAARPEDAGEYLCRAENQHGESSLAFNLTVECEILGVQEGIGVPGRAIGGP